MNWAIFILMVVLFGLSVNGPVFAQEQSTVAPWVFEIKGGGIKPDLDRYEEFYGSDTTAYFATTLAYRPSDWYEIGGELGFMHDSGVGILVGNQALGGSVKYTLVPAHLYVSVLGRFSPGQWVVPYAGIGASARRWRGTSRTSKGNRIAVVVPIWATTLRWGCNCW